MANLLGRVAVHVLRGVNLAIRDVIIGSSDPYVVVEMGQQRLRTRVVRRNVNPQWHERLDLDVFSPVIPVRITVYDRDTITRDDYMGEAEFDIGPLIDAVRTLRVDLPNGTTIDTIHPNRENCLSQDSCIIWIDGNVVQNLFLRLRNVERGEVELQLQWIGAPGAGGS